MATEEQLEFPFFTVTVVRKACRKPELRILPDATVRMEVPLFTTEAEIRSLIAWKTSSIRSLRNEIREANDPSWRPETITIDDLTFELRRRDVRGGRLRCEPNFSTGNIIVTAPLDLPAEDIRRFMAKDMEKFRAMVRSVRSRLPALVAYESGEKHPLWGREYTLQTEEYDGPGDVRIKGNTMILSMPPGTPVVRRREIMRWWYKCCVIDAVEPLLAHYEERMGLTVSSWSVRYMTSRWGSCTPQNRSIRLNSMLARLPKEALEYVLVHEMCHLAVRRHGPDFYELLGRWYPDWKKVSDFLSRAGLGILV